jgi:hypothetical protein
MTRTYIYIINKVLPANHFKNQKPKTRLQTYSRSVEIKALGQDKSLQLMLASVRTQDLIKPLFKPGLSWWSSGMISRLIFNYDVLYSQKLGSVTSSRKLWGIWNYTANLWWVSLKNQVCHYNPWSLRIRRFFNSTALKNSLSTIYFNNRTGATKKRRIKRWLKKKYTTQSWR